MNRKPPGMPSTTWRSIAKYIVAPEKWAEKERRYQLDLLRKKR